jgi:pimeloyl-ACP methyl ester carboxylesterase
MGASQSAVVEAARSNARSNTFDRLGSITVPVMIIQGRHDKVRTAEHAAAMREQIADCQVVVLSNSGHTPQLEGNRCGGITYKFCARVEMMSSVAD